MDRQQLQDLLHALQQFGIFHGLLAGLTALIRGAYEKEGVSKALLDAALCVIIGTLVFYIPMLDEYLAEHPRHAADAVVVIGVVGAQIIITTVRDSFVAAIKQLNPLTWFKKK